MTFREVTRISAPEPIGGVDVSGQPQQRRQVPATGRRGGRRDLARPDETATMFSVTVISWVTPLESTPVPCTGRRCSRRASRANSPAGSRCLAAQDGERPHTPATIPGIASGESDQKGSAPTTTTGDDRTTERTCSVWRTANVIMSAPA